MLIQWFTVPVNPEPWVVGAVGTSNRGGTKRGFVAPDPQLQNYQAAVKEHIMTFFPQRRIVDNECELNLYFYRRLDRYTTANDRGHMRHVADATNLQKAVEDALQDVLVTNDRLVRRVTSEIVAQDPDVEPGIIICLRSKYVPVWEAEIPSEVLNAFNEERDMEKLLDLGNVL